MIDAMFALQDAICRAQIRLANALDSLRMADDEVRSAVAQLKALSPDLRLIITSVDNYR